MTKTHKHKWVPIPGLRRFPQRLCRCGMIKSNGVQAGQNTIILSPPGVGDVARWSATQNAVASGDIGMNTVSGRIQQFRSGLSQSVADLSDIASLTTETLEFVPRAEIITTGDAGRADQTNLEGGSYVLDRTTEFNRVHFRISARVGAPTMAWGLYQVSGGVMGTTATRIASATGVGPFGAAGNFTWTPTEGTVTLTAGLVFVLHGRDSGAGSYTLRVYSANSQDLLNQNIPATADLHPLEYTTTFLASGGLPATINPLQVAVGGDLTPTTTNVVPIVRFENV